ncbi:MAG: hypothetical protein JNM70_13825 [Anaerolineae bacterium]|nr:hypothetical protein [Anaerolineae bacterium]
MAVQFTWYDRKHGIARYTFIGDWTWAEFYTTYVQASLECTVVRQELGRFDTIADLSRNATIPANILSHITRIAERPRVESNLVIFITDDRWLTALYTVAAQFSSRVARRYRMAASLEEALDIIARDRQRQQVASA